MSKQIRRILAAVIGSAAVIGAVLAGAGAASPAIALPFNDCHPVTSETGGVMTLTVGHSDAVRYCLWTVPAGVTSVTMIANGAQGGGVYGGSAGVLGGEARLSFTVGAGEAFVFQVGGTGGTGAFTYPGGGGPFTGATGGMNDRALCGGGGGGGGTFVWKGAYESLGYDVMYLAGGGGGGAAAPRNCIGDGSDGGGGGGGGGYSATSPGHVALGAPAVLNQDGPSGSSFFGGTDIEPTGTRGSMSNGVQAGDGSVVISFLQIPTATTLVSRFSTSAYGQPLYLTATVSPAPSEGTVEFQSSTDGGHTWTAISNCTTVVPDSTTGQAKCTPIGPALPVGDENELLAIYSDNAAQPLYVGSQSDVVHQDVLSDRAYFILLLNIWLRNFGFHFQFGG